MKNIKLYVSGLGAGALGYVLPLLAHAQAFSVSTSTEATNNGGYLTTAYGELINFLTSTGGVLFMIVMTILGIVVWLAVKSPRHVVSS
jgi:hypothetical protein